MNAQNQLTVPEEFEDWPFDAKAFVLAEANGAKALRHEIDSLAGMSHDNENADNAGSFTKAELATLVMALGGPEDLT